MRRENQQQRGCSFYIWPEQRVAADHPLRPIRKVPDELVVTVKNLKLKRLNAIRLEAIWLEVFAATLIAKHSARSAVGSSNNEAQAGK